MPVSDVKCVLFHDNFQNFKSYPLKKAQLAAVTGAMMKNITAELKDPMTRELFCRSCTTQITALTATVRIA